MTAQSISVSGIYKITNSVNQDFYLGSAVNFKSRWALHLRDLRKGSHCNRRLQLSFHKYGESVLIFSIVEFVADKANLLVREQHWLDRFAELETCYNVCKIAGSRLGSKVSDASRKLMSASAKGRVISPEHRASISAAMKGIKRTPEHLKNQSIARTGKKFPKISEALRGRKVSQETIEKQRAAITGRKQTPEAIANQRAAMMGREVSDETRARISASNSGRPVPQERRDRISATLTGKKQTAETIEKRAKSFALTIAARRLKAQ